ncbi:MAG: rod shape-determining protein MreB [Clostridia bacterium]|nr:rod shape-determining protein MreB [Clostridia bacterium]
MIQKIKEWLSKFSLIQDVGVDLGTSSVLVYVKGKGVVLTEPSVVAVNSVTKEPLAVGYKAQRMLGRTPGSIIAVRPLSDGVISDYDFTAKMLKEFLKSACPSKLIGPRVIVCVPSGVTEVEKRAVIDATIQAGASKVRIIEEPIAAAIGAGIDITQPCGNMVVDIGGGTTDIAVISLDGMVEQTSIKVAGDNFDEAIVRFVRKKYNMLIGERTAEELKKNIGCVIPREEELRAEIRGRCLVTGLPKTIIINSSELAEALVETAIQIADAVHSVLERTLPELVADISENGIVITGGGGLIWGLDTLLQKRTGIKVSVADDAISCVVMGTGKALEYINKLQDENVRKKLIY